MNIIIASAEAAPLAKAGGLADVATSLAVQWKKLGHSPIIILPKYAFINPHEYGFKPTFLTLYVPIGNWVEFAHLWAGKIPGTDVPVYLIENRDYYNRLGIYGEDGEYPDNDRRFIFFSRAVFEAAKAIDFTPDIIHAHDYHAAFSMAFLKSHYRFDPRFSKAAGVYTIHNLAYQGWFDPKRALFFAQIGMEQFYPGSWFEKNGAVNAMKVGIMFADKITTVSPTYAKEIRMSYYSEGLQNELNLRGADLIGILNGADYDLWDPEKDDALYSKYTKDYLQGKLCNKRRFLRENGIENGDSPDLPLIGMVSRLAEQKGIDLIMNKLEWALNENMFRFALIGSGEKRYEDFFKYISWKYPDKTVIVIGFDEKISRRILASSDFALLPSRFEPCGLTQMYALKYGSIPIVRETGGLKDTVKEYNYRNGTGNGFLFWQYNADDMLYAVRKALDIYKQEPHWSIIRRNAMSENFSAQKSAMEYIKVFQWALEKIGQ